jgi:hypothetical protein
VPDETPVARRTLAGSRPGGLPRLDAAQRLDIGETASISAWPIRPPAPRLAIRTAAVIS